MSKPMWRWYRADAMDPAPTSGRVHGWREAPGRRRGSRAFSLLALLVLLIVVGAAAMVAIRSTSESIGQSRHVESEQILRNIKRGVIGSIGSESASGGTPNGFFSDMGRVPRARTNLQGQLTLSELVSASGPGYSLPPYQTYLLVASNVVSPPIPIGAKQDRTVSVPDWLEKLGYQFRGGWRGPYYNTDTSGGRIVEGWGRDLASQTGSSVQLLTYRDPDRYLAPPDPNRYKPWLGFTNAWTNRTLVDGVGITGSGLLATPATQSDTYKIENHRMMFDDSGVDLFGDLLLKLTLFGKRGQFECDIIFYALNPDADQIGSRPIVAYYFTTFWKSDGFIESDVYIPHLPAGQKVIVGSIYTQKGNSPPGQQKNVSEPMLINIQAGRLNYAAFSLAFDFLNLKYTTSPNNVPSGAVTLDPPGIGANGGGFDYSAASYVKMTAIDTNGLTFKRWTTGTGNNIQILSTNRVFEVRMTQDWLIQAVY